MPVPSQEEGGGLGVRKGIWPVEKHHLKPHDEPRLNCGTRPTRAWHGQRTLNDDDDDDDDDDDVLLLATIPAYYFFRKALTITILLNVVSAVRAGLTVCHII